MEYRASKNKFIRLTLILYILMSTIMLVTTFCKYLLIDFSFFISGRGIFLFLLILLLCFSLLKFAGFYQEIIINSVFVISFFSFGLAGLLVRGLGSYIIPNEFYRYQTIETRKTNESYEKLYPTTGIYGVETGSEIIYDHPIIKQGVYKIDEKLELLKGKFHQENEFVETENFFFKATPYLFGFDIELKTIDFILLPFYFILNIFFTVTPLVFVLLAIEILLYYLKLNKSILNFFEY